MGDYRNLPVSDGTGDAALMHVDADRIIGSTTLSVDSVSNVPTGFFIATTGTLLSTGFIDPSTKTDFFGHLDGSDLAIDGFCPGSSDNGNTIGQVVVIKPNTAWADLVAQFIINASGHGTPEDLTADDLAAATIHASGLITAAGGFTLSGGSFTVPAGAILKAALEKAHYGCLYFSGDGGTVFGNSQVTTPYNVADTTNGYGITADTTAHTLTTTRAGLYVINARNTCVDVNAASYINWLYINDGSGVQGLRSPVRQVAVGETINDTWKIYLPSGAIIYHQNYNGAGNTRFGGPGASGTSSDFKRRMCMSLTVAEVR